MGQPSLLSENDLGGEGDLFKAPEPFIEEPPLLGLDPVTAAISMMSGSDNDTIKVGLSEVLLLYECEKELMEKSAIEETISELLDVNIPMVQVPCCWASPPSAAAGGECSLQKSVNGTLSSVRPNFLDFQGLDFQAAFGLRTAYSEGDIQKIRGDMGQPSLLSEYDLGGEGDLFKAPEPFIEEPPLLRLDPVAAAISMMSGGDNDTINVGLSEVLLLYEYEKELMEKSAIEETITELLDSKIPMLQVPAVELRASPPSAAAGGECSLQKSMSVTSPSVRVRPNFLDFQGLDLEGLRTAYSQGDSIQNLGDNTPWPGNSGNVDTSCERLVTIGDLKTEERSQKLSRYRKKKIKRNFGRKIKYACRKAMADSLPRVGGRFAKMDDGDMLKPRK